MKSAKFLILTITAILLSSCHHASEPLYIPQEYTQLNTVVAPWQKDNDLLPWNGVYHLMLINSIGDVRATQTEKFIEANPNWLNVDFTTKSIVAFRTLMVASNYWQYTKVLGFSLFNGDQDYHMVKGDYYMNIEECYSRYNDEELEDESQYRIYQIAIVTDKIPSDANIITGTSSTIIS